MPKAKAKVATQQANIHAVVGSDESEVKRVATELSAKLLPPDAGDFGLEIIDGCADNAEQAATRIRSAIEALQTLPFLGGTKLVWLKNANFLGDTIIGKAASVQEALEQLSGVLDAGFGPEVTFLLSATELDKRRSFLQGARQTRGSAGFRSTRFKSRRLGRRGHGNRPGPREEEKAAIRR